MQERSKTPSEVWVSLLWAQYNKLPEPLKEGFVSLAQSMAKETESGDRAKTKEAAVPHVAVGDRHT
ncbi:MAG: hypothetical protein LBQ89_07275 [Treponema sp.]|jgi:hypothetical protein|nr:hypothetical protein [Treponema sp.]